MKYAIDSLDLILGVVGGFAGLVWSTFSCCIGGYESFRQETEQLESFYSSGKRIKSHSIVGEEEDTNTGDNEGEHGPENMAARINKEFEGR